MLYVFILTIYTCSHPYPSCCRPRIYRSSHYRCTKGVLPLHELFLDGIIYFLYIVPSKINNSLDLVQSIKAL